jgi:NAD(P)-dependent dehydrogenase (short-subunit alcohol dehydrogenase family)
MDANSLVGNCMPAHCRDSGFETAKGLLKHGFRVIIACRDVTKGKVAIDKIKLALKDEAIECMQLDLSSFASVCAFAAAYISRGLPLHVCFSTLLYRLVFLRYNSPIGIGQ